MPRVAADSSRTIYSPLNSADATFVERALTDLWNYPAKRVALPASDGGEREYLVLAIVPVAPHDDSGRVERAVFTSVADARNFLLGGE